MPVRHVLFDLDGRLTDPGEGIVRCFQYALGRLGRPCPPADELFRFIEPPNRTAFGELLRSQDAGLFEQAVATCRERFASVGLYENRVYGGVLEACGTPGVGCTWRPPSRRSTPGRCCATAPLMLTSTTSRATSWAAGESLMVGDRRHDVTAAKRNGPRCVGVTNGYGSKEELAAAGADNIVGSPGAFEELIKAAYLR
jgi:phosphoglycolate phosphatase